MSERAECVGLLGPTRITSDSGASARAALTRLVFPVPAVCTLSSWTRRYKERENMRAVATWSRNKARDVSSRFLKAVLQYAENLEVQSSREKNQWGKVVKLTHTVLLTIRAFSEKKQMLIHLAEKPK